MKSLSEQIESVERKLAGHNNYDEKTQTFRPTNSNPQRKERLLFKLAKLHNDQLVEMMQQRSSRSHNNVPEVVETSEK